jgi:hypothetical protein
MAAKSRRRDETYSLQAKIPVALVDQIDDLLPSLGSSRSAKASYIITNWMVEALQDPNRTLFKSGLRRSRKR